MQQPSQPEMVLKTFRYLRLAMVLLVGLLAAGVLWQIFRGHPHCLQRSISAYYYTPARSVFVAALGAIGVGLIVYRGNSRIEDVLLNFTGIAAGVIAFVPTQVDTANGCQASDVPTPAALAAAVTNNGWALLITGVLALVVSVIVSPRALAAPAWRGLLGWWRALTSAVVLSGVVFFIADRSGFRDNGHDAAAICLFAGIVAVVLTNAISYAEHQGASKYTNRYAVVAAAMVLTVAGLIAAHFAAPSFSTWLFWLEAGVIFEFGGFWVIQTEELWGAVDRAGTRSRRAP